MEAAPVLRGPLFEAQRAFPARASRGKARTVVVQVASDTALFHPSQRTRRTAQVVGESQVMGSRSARIQRGTSRMTRAAGDGGHLVQRDWTSSDTRRPYLENLGVRGKAPVSGVLPSLPALGVTGKGNGKRLDQRDVGRLDNRAP